MKGPDSNGEVPPEIPDHVLLRRIGKGGYGEVWLARNMTGAFRGVKVVHRHTFTDERPFQRECEGVCRFEPVSRSHPGLVTILHVGQNGQAGYFYYVMELADDARTGQIIDVNSYVPKTLREELSNQRRLPLHKQLEIALSLTSALEYLHGQNLIHRDIKPPNIIFANGMAKLADVGLMVEGNEDVSLVGSVGFIPPERPGTPAADIYSLGKVFYELFMGLPCKRFPELPGAAEDFTAVPALLQLNNLVLKACHNDPKERFQNATELRHALRAVAETVQEKRPGIRERASGGVTPGIETDSNRMGAEKRRSPEKTTDAPQKSPARGGKRWPKPTWTSVAATLLALLTIAASSFFAGKWQRGESPPSIAEKQQRWEALYRASDSVLISFLGNIAAASPRTKFLVYSRGTDTNWLNPAYHQEWIRNAESRIPALKDRLDTMLIPGGQDGTFRDPETGRRMRARVSTLLYVSNNVAVVVLMDTTADRGVYDLENRGKGITNAEEVEKVLRSLRLGSIYKESISLNWINEDWVGEARVLSLFPDLVIIHRSSFFHPLNAQLGFGYPPFTNHPAQTTAPNLKGGVYDTNHQSPNQ